MSVLHVCKFKARSASRVVMQIGWDKGECIDLSDNNSVGRISYFRMICLAFSRGQSSVVFHMQSALPYFFVYWFFSRCSGNKARLIYDIHDLNELSLSGGWYVKMRFYIFYLLEGLAFKVADELMIASKGLSRIYYKRYKRAAWVIANISRGKLSGRGGAIRNNFIYFGLIDGVRLPGFYLEKMRDLGLSFDVYGVYREADEGYGDLYNKLIDEGVINFRGEYVPDEIEFISSYKASLMLFDASEVNIRYCLPNKLFQSLAHGVPCLISPDLFEASLLFKKFPDFVVRAANDEIASIFCGNYFVANERLKALDDYIGVLSLRSRINYENCVFK